MFRSCYFLLVLDHLFLIVTNSGFLNRRSFLKLLLVAGTGLILALWYKLTMRNRILNSKQVTIRIDKGKLGKGIHFYDNFILFIQGEQAITFSNRCTHAGCIINHEIAGELVCQCHGSKFDAATGRVLRGPAIMPLKKIPHSFDLKTGELVVKP